MQGSQNAFIAASTFVFIDFLGELLFSPLWWYTRGVKKAFLWFISSVRSFEDHLSVTLWIRYIFVPMYGQYDWRGRIISFFMRVVQIIARSILFVIGSIFFFIIFLLWIVFPVIIVYQIVSYL